MERFPELVNVKTYRKLIKLIRNIQPPDKTNENNIEYAVGDSVSDAFSWGQSQGEAKLAKKIRKILGE